MHITLREDPDATCLVVDGELDLSTAESLYEYAQRTLRDRSPRRLRVDAARLTFCDSSGIHALVRIHAEATARGALFHLNNVHGAVRRVLAITGVLTALTTPSDASPPSGR
ncbi:STAS domain-containing protein [Catenuloplanes atrovinosus]|uniref:Anti-sigma factor antagonist n=1 Tax=Catenuloplanes atrovinosus TaxID=137266 RepID=A0AAE3YRW4_9ACTN|nr:STAS domain-containing protein [Catenuloplanes atrovinosus]MDR7277323.1 anti-anti-sigma factor [Catenuloplanes atrovinosus]